MTIFIQLHHSLTSSAANTGSHLYSSETRVTQ